MSKSHRTLSSIISSPLPSPLSLSKSSSSLPRRYRSSALAPSSSCSSTPSTSSSTSSSTKDIRSFHTSVTSSHSHQPSAAHHAQGSTIYQSFLDSPGVNVYSNNRPPSPGFEGNLGGGGGSGSSNNPSGSTNSKGSLSLSQDSSSLSPLPTSPTSPHSTTPASHKPLPVSTSALSHLSPFTLLPSGSATATSKMLMRGLERERDKDEGRRDKGYVLRTGGFGIPKERERERRAAAKGKGKEVVRPGTDESSSVSSTSTSTPLTPPLTPPPDSDYLATQVGEDAYFLLPHSLGLADGVGGFSSHAFGDPARFSKKLMHHCCLISMSLGADVDADMDEGDVVEILERAWEDTRRECTREGIVGGSTALLVRLEGEEVRGINVGDGRCFIIRDNDFLFRSEEQQHSFNFPFQLGTKSTTTPKKDGQAWSVKVRKDDIIILSSDGLADNLFDDDILEEVLRFSSPQISQSSSPTPSSVLSPSFSPQALSEALCSRAKAVSEDQRAVTSPFQVKAMEEGIHHVGGKRDDITVLVSVVGEV